MSVTVTYTCDWCGETIDDRLVTVTVSVQDSVLPDRHRERERRHYHQGASTDSVGCIDRALRALDHLDLEAPDKGMEWRLMPIEESPREARAKLVDRAYSRGGIHQLPIEGGAFDALLDAGLVTIEDLVSLDIADLCKIRGIGVNRAKAILRATEAARDSEVAR